MKLRSRYRLVIVTLLSFGLIGAVAPFWLKEWVESVTDNPNLDKIHAVSQGLGLLALPSVPVTLVRIDDQSFEAWQRPFPITKAIIAGLIEKARATSPRAILVDLDISAGSGKDAKVLHDLLDSWAPSDPPLLFPRELSFDPDGNSLPALPSDFDRHFKIGKPLFWVNVLFEVGEGDKIRNWNLWEVPKGACQALLSPAMLTYAFNLGGTAMVETAQRYLGSREGADCALEGQDMPSAVPRWLSDAEKSSAIQFSFPKSDTAMSAMMVEDGHGPALIQLSGYQFAQRPIAASALVDRFVIIGNSYASNGDFHDTPIGEMEGMRVIANAVANSTKAIAAAEYSTKVAVILSSIFLAGLVAFLTFTFKSLISAPLALLVGIVVYTACNINLGASAAQSVVQYAIVIWVLVIALESVESICRGFLEGRSWRSFLNG